MRSLLLSLGLMLLVTSAAPAAVSSPIVLGSTAVSMSTTFGTADSLQNPARDIHVDIDVDRGSAGWYRNPVWIAVGGLAVLVLLLIIVVAMRGGGGTTIVHER